jgi:hypothetical protein
MVALETEEKVTAFACVVGVATAKVICALGLFVPLEV